jgi:hypothetical protein
MRLALLPTIMMLMISLNSCVYPGISLNKGHLLDPTMDPAKTDSLSDGVSSWPAPRLERSSIASGGSSGSSCPTCR